MKLSAEVSTALLGALGAHVQLNKLYAIKRHLPFQGRNNIETISFRAEFDKRFPWLPLDVKTLKQTAEVFNPGATVTEQNER